MRPDFAKYMFCVFDSYDFDVPGYRYTSKDLGELRENLSVKEGETAKSRNTLTDLGSKHQQLQANHQKVRRPATANFSHHTNVRSRVMQVLEQGRSSGLVLV